MRRLAAISVFALTTAVAWSAPAGAQDGLHVAAGVTVGGVDVGGLTDADVRTKLTAELVPKLGQKIVVQVGTRRFSLAPAKANVQFYASGSAKAALAAAPGAALAPDISYSKLAATAFVTATANAVYVTPRDAKATIKISKIRVSKARAGKRLSNVAVEAAVDRALADPTAPHTIASQLLSAAPKVTVKDLKRQYRTVITVSRSQFKLRLFKNLKVAKSYKVAVGMPGHATPTGRFAIHDKAVNPVWSVPNSEWAGELAGTTVQGGSAQNPLKARWMGIANGIGIHGTGEEYSVGSRASHGCVRMRVKDVIQLYPRVPVGTPVLIR